MRVAAWANHVLEFCYPHVCSTCEALSDGFLCNKCQAELNALAARAACEKCARPLATRGDPCPSCHGKGIHPFDRIVALGVYDEPLRGLLHQMKYHKRWPLAEQLGQQLAATEQAKGILTHASVLVPVPLHARRQIARGYNQAEVLARKIGGRCRIPVSLAASRVRETETQTHLHSYDKRMENLRGAFALKKPRALRGQHVVIVDDVITTGATLKSLAGAMKQAEPASICALVLGVADPKGHGFETV